MRAFYLSVRPDGEVGGDLVCIKCVFTSGKVSASDSWHAIDNPDPSRRCQICGMPVGTRAERMKWRMEMVLTLGIILAVVLVLWIKATA